MKKIKELVVQDKNINKFIEKILYYYKLWKCLINSAIGCFSINYTVEKSGLTFDKMDKFGLSKLINKLLMELLITLFITTFSV